MIATNLLYSGRERRISRRAEIFPKSLIPGVDSAPEAISRAQARLVSRDSAAFSTVIPPARMMGGADFSSTKLAAVFQSIVRPVPP